MANLQMVKFDIIMKEVISSNSGLVLTNYYCPQGMDFLQVFMLLESLFRNSGHSGNYWFSRFVHTVRQRQQLFCRNGAKVFTLCGSGSGKVACNVMQNILPLPFCHSHSHTEWGWNLFTCIAITTATATAAQCEQVHLILWNPIVMPEKCCRCHNRCHTM